MANTDKDSGRKSQINNNVKDYSNQPFFIDKANQSKVFLDKHGFPKIYLKKGNQNLILKTSNRIVQLKRQQNEETHS